MGNERPNAKDFRSHVEETFGDDVSCEVTKMRRFSSGIYSLDCALGGGWPHGTFNLLVGLESTCKSTVVLKSASEINKINYETGEIDLSYSEPCGVLYVDLEGSFEQSWARKNGFDIDRQVNEIVSTSDGQKAVDVVNHAIVENYFGLIIVDSNELMVSMKAMNQSAEDTVIGDRARILNDGYRRWVLSRVKQVKRFSEEPWKIPTILAINQIREKIGVMFGSPEVIPGGIGQRQNSSIIVRMHSPSIENDSAKTYGMGTFKGITQKNKTFSPKRNFSFGLALTDTDELRQGEVDNAGAIFSDAKDLGLLYKEGSAWKIGDESFRVQADFRSKLRSDPLYLNQMWKFVANQWRIAAENRKEENVEPEQE